MMSGYEERKGMLSLCEKDVFSWRSRSIASVLINPIFQVAFINMCRKTPPLQDGDIRRWFQSYQIRTVFVK